MSEWSETTVARFASSMRKRRQALGLSAQQLADRTAEMGHPINRSSIAGWENGTRGDRLLLTDALVLADALRFPLSALLYPEMPDGTVEALPGVTTESIWAAGALSGESLNLGWTPDSPRDDELDGGRELYIAARKVQETRDYLQLMRLKYEAQMNNGDLDTARETQAVMDTLTTALQEQIKTVRRLGGVVNDG